LSSTGAAEMTDTSYVKETKAFVDLVEEELLQSEEEYLSDPEAQKRYEKEQKRKLAAAQRNKKKSINQKLAKQLVGILIFLICTTTIIITAVMWSSISEFFWPYVEDEYVIIDPSATVILASQPAMAVNNNNFVFVDTTRTVGDTDFHMSRMLIDSSYTVFYFDGDVNWQGYNVRLADGNGAEIGVRNSFFTDRIGNRLEFDPINFDTNMLHFTISNTETNEAATFQILLDGSLIVMPTRHLLNRVTMITDDGMPVVITGGHFSSAGNVLYYYIDTYGMQGSVHFDSAFVVQGSSNTMARNNQMYKLYDDRVIGRLEFDALPTIGGSFNLRLAEVYQVYSVGTGFNVMGLLNNNLESQIRIPVGTNTVILERMARIRTEQVNMYIIPLHGLNEEGVRVETRPIASLTIFNSQGASRTVEGIVRSGPQGSDISFDMNQLPENDGFSGVINNAILNIESIQMATEDLRIEVPLVGLLSEVSYTDSVVIEEARSMLMSRNYQRVDLISYMIEPQYFVGVYSALLNGVVTEYVVYGYRVEGALWEYTLVRQ